MNDELIIEIKRMSNLLALYLIKDMKTEVKFQLLNTAGFQAKEIAELCNTTPNTVSVALSKLRKNKISKKKDTKNGEE